ncbi:MAG: response regulator [Planktothrix sp.]
MTKISIVLVEDHDLTRVGLRTALEQESNMKIVGEAANGKKGLEILKQTQPDIAIIDIGLPDMDGIELTQKFKQHIAANRARETKVLILTMHDNEDAVMGAFAAGADSYSVKDVSLDKLKEAINTTYEGNAWIDPVIARTVLKQAKKKQPDIPIPAPGDQKTVMINAVEPEYQQFLESCPLTERELEVLELIVAGRSNAEIAEKLYITVGTVKTHVRSILNKLCADDRTQAAVRALRSGWIE